LRSLDDRNVQQDQRMDRADSKIDTMWQRVWQIPIRVPSPAEEQQRQDWQRK
jgi:hypothetical protein